MLTANFVRRKNNNKLRSRATNAPSNAGATPTNRNADVAPPSNDARSAADAGDESGAETLYRSAIELDPTGRDALVEWARLLSGRGQVDEAIELVHRARDGAEIHQCSVG